jgi:hypothetical protein
MWIPPEEVGLIFLHAPTRKSIGIFGAVRSEDGCLATNREKKFDVMTCLSFLKSRCDTIDMTGGWLLSSIMLAGIMPSI